MQPATGRSGARAVQSHFLSRRFRAANVTGGIVTTAAEARDVLTRQVTGAVRWIDCVQSLKDAGADLFIETGPGKVLCGLLKQIDPALKSLNVEDAASLEKALVEIRG